MRTITAKEVGCSRLKIANSRAVYRFTMKTREKAENKRKYVMSILQREFKQKGRPFNLALDHAIRLGLRCHEAIRVARQVYKMYGLGGPRSRKIKIVRGGAVSPR